MILTRQQALEIFRRRVSTRHYDPARKISAEDFAAILDFGRLSPSSFFSELMERRGFTPEQRAAALERYRSFQTHDIAIADDERALFDWASKQSYIALANMLTGAAMLGIDSCPIEGMDYAAVEHILAQARLLDPAEYGVSVAATFGYRARDIQPKPRRDAAETVVWAE